jgi:hypothetical protein
LPPPQPPHFVLGFSPPPRPTPPRLSATCARSCESSGADPMSSIWGGGVGEVWDEAEGGGKLGGGGAQRVRTPAAAPRKKGAR